MHEGAHPSASQGTGGQRFPSVIARVRAACARYRVARAFAGAKRGRALDFGCGQGFYLAALQRSGFEAQGVELSTATAARACAAGHRVATSLDALAGQRYVALVSIHVLEHLEAPADVLGLLTARLEPGARFLVEVPCATGWQGRLFGRRWLHDEAGLHVHHFSPAALAALLAGAGLAVERTSHYSFEHGLIGWIQSLYNLAFPYNRFFRAIVLNNSMRARAAAWPELVLFPLALAVGALAFAVESLAGSGAVIRATGRYTPPAAPRPGDA